MNATSAEPARKRWGRWGISVFILVHIYIMVFWGMPGSQFRAYMTAPVQDYVINSGLWHSWDMFSPDPLSVNYRLHAQVFFQDGALKVWEFPRMEKLGYFERYQKERFRKWRERVRQDLYSGVWDDTARYIARLHNDSTNRPTRVVLVRQWEGIPPLQLKPGSPDYQDYQPMPKNFDDLKFSYRFKYYDVRPEDLRP